MLFKNSKTGESFETDLDWDEALKIARADGRGFHFSLAQQFDSGKPLTQNQQFWLFKLALKKKDPVVIDLRSDVTEFMKKARRVMWHVENLEGYISARVKLYWNDEEKITKVFYSGGDSTRYAGHIEGDKFYPKRNLSLIAAQLIVFSEDPLRFLAAMGKEWGICCVCGRELENEESVRLGIGPICLGRVS